MSTHSVAATAQPPMRQADSGGVLRLQRKCACGGSEGLAEGCESCRTQKLLGLQAQLTVGRAGDRFESEADQVADRVLAGHRAAPDAAAPV
ncbi:MAG: hypothetical protein JWQ03_3000, partial [Variovorax sp.]|nr:hypothetical protein [Variovorax sp.]